MDLNIVHGNFVYVCLEIANISMMFTCCDSVEPIRYTVCDVYVGCRVWGWFVVGGSFGFLINMRFCCPSF